MLKSLSLASALLLSLCLIGSQNNSESGDSTSNGGLAAGVTGARFDFEHFVDNALIRPEPNRVAKETSNRTEFTSIRTAAAGFDGNDMKGLPLDPE